ncbi:hypothetical protein QQF64_017510 [Cirrhinus molitorella]|uniref:Uncharacterized protein n=1 Tax=Cirrhinus molitorella TaxID=172907 RepID=A0ABR3LIW3_9TELE
MKILPVWNNVKESASASSHAERTQQRSECGRSPGASAPTTASPVSRIAAPYQSTLSLSGVTIIGADANTGLSVNMYCPPPPLLDLFLEDLRVGGAQAQKAHIPSPFSLSFSLARSHTRYFPARSLKPARLDRFALIVPDELLHFLANVSPSAIGKERNEGKSLPPWRCHFHTLRLAACQQTGHSKEAEWTERNQEPNDHS